MSREIKLVRITVTDFGRLGGAVDFSWALRGRYPTTVVSDSTVAVPEEQLEEVQSFLRRNDCSWREG